jgi:hypothetical protein
MVANGERVTYIGVIRDAPPHRRGRPAPGRSLRHAAPGTMSSSARDGWARSGLLCGTWAAVA